MKKKDLRVLYKIYKTSYNTSYTMYVMTPQGEMTEKEWKERVKKRIKDNNELEIFNKLKEYCRNELAWLKQEDEIELYSLELYAARIFENKEWAGYKQFNNENNEYTEIEGVQLSLF